MSSVGNGFCSSPRSLGLSWGTGGLGRISEEPRFVGAGAESAGCVPMPALSPCHRVPIPAPAVRHLPMGAAMTPYGQRGPWGPPCCCAPAQYAVESLH